MLLHGQFDYVLLFLFLFVFSFCLYFMSGCLQIPMRGSISESESDEPFVLTHEFTDEVEDTVDEIELRSYSTQDGIEMMWRLLLQRAAAIPAISDAILNRWI
jgi:hypothetical protein